MKRTLMQVSPHSGFDIPSDSDSESGDKPQRPKIGGDLAKPLSLTDPSRPEDIDISGKKEINLILYLLRKENIDVVLTDTLSWSFS